MKTTVFSVVFLAISLSISVSSISHANQETPQIATKQEAKDSAQDQQDSNQAKKQSSSTDGTMVDRRNAAKEDIMNKHDEKNEYWPPVLGFKLKVTDSFLVLFTAVLAVFTGLLWHSTHRLWEETRANSIIAEKSAKAAERSADIANKSLTISQRAFVFGGFNSAPNFVDNKIENYIFWVDWENVGITPATHVQSWINFQTFPIAENREPNFNKLDPAGATAILGPRSTGKSAYKSIPIATMKENWNRQTVIFIWALIEYRDVFDPIAIHHHELCARINLLHEPSTAPPKDHPSYVQFIAYGPQNRTK